MTETNNQQPIHQTLKALASVDPPAGINDRIALKLAEHRVKQTSAIAPMRKFWLTAAVAAACAATVVCVLTLQTAHNTPTPIAANTSSHPLLPSIASSNAQPVHPAQHLQTRLHQQPHTNTDAPLPHTAPPAPLTEQERLLIALANRPALAAASAISQPVPNHGLGVNALTDLEGTPLPSMQAALHELNATPTSPGENQ